MKSDVSKDYEYVVQELYSLLPYYKKSGEKAFKPGLERIQSLCRALSIPLDTMKFVHVGGTNGKGSVSHMIAAVLHEHGHKVGLYTSPHVIDFRERFKINGVPISKELTLELVDETRPLWESLKPSFFELTVALAFLAFWREGCDINVIEVGLGGRLDSTNIIDPEVSVITNIDLEHTQVLGDTIQEIAFEKGGIIKPEKPIVLGSMKTEAAEVLRQLAKERASEVYESDALMRISEISMDPEEGLLRVHVLSQMKGLKEVEFDYAIDTLAVYQAENMATAMVALEALARSSDHFYFDDGTTKRALKSFAQNTSFYGRFQVIGRQPLVVADAMHNPAAAAKVGETIQRIRPAKVHAILGFSRDKNIEEMISFFPSSTEFYFCGADTPRNLKPSEIKERINAGLVCSFFENSGLALEAARSQASENDLIFVGGSIFILENVIAK